ncbi:Major facilitator superfamily protein [Rhynchospora pubera]|uniref:Major facilitator superfamily protein n=1 Tax=Rhynchospora pubera TaxID=906938 RepID=A0AAV8DZV4_9POAL|nr:Major facilitator superfamily protein [Rhynchospora pubera]
MMSIYPWLTLVAIIWLQAVNGTNTTFPAYSSALKSRLGISQLNLNNLAVASDLGKVFGWCSGIALNHLPLWLVLIVGVAIGAFGYGVQFLFLTTKISTVEYWQAFLLCVISGKSICWINTVCYVAAMQKFPNKHGIVISLTTSYSGISAKVYIAMAEVILGKTNPNNKSIYLLQNSLVPLAVAIIVLPVLHDTKSVVGGEKKVGLSIMFFMAGLTGAYAILTTTAPEFITIKQRMPMAILLGMIMSTCLVPLLLKARFNIMSKNKVTTIHEVTKRTVEEAREDEEMEERKGREYGVWDLVRSLDFWLYFGVYGCGGTLGLVYANNLGQIAQSSGMSEAELVSISSSFGFFGKLGSALLSALASSRQKHVVSNTASLAMLMVPMAISFFLLLIPSKIFLLAGTAIIGMSTGAITSLAVSITSELFGFKHFAINHNLLVANIPIGSFLFGYIAARIYDSKGGEVHRVCNGSSCFHQTFLIWGFICAVGTVLSFVLYYRTSRSHKALDS